MAVKNLSKSDRNAIVAALIFDRMITEKVGQLAVDDNTARNLAMMSVVRAEGLLSYVDEAESLLRSPKKPVTQEKAIPADGPT